MAFKDHWVWSGNEKEIERSLSTVFFETLNDAGFAPDVVYADSASTHGIVREGYNPTEVFTWATEHAPVDRHVVPFNRLLFQWKSDLIHTAATNGSTRRKYLQRFFENVCSSVKTDVQHTLDTARNSIESHIGAEGLKLGTVVTQDPIKVYVEQNMMRQAEDVTVEMVFGLHGSNAQGFHAWVPAAPLETAITEIAYSENVESSPKEIDLVAMLVEQVMKSPKRYGRQTRKNRFIV